MDEGTPLSEDALDDAKFSDQVSPCYKQQQKKNLITFLKKGKQIFFNIKFFLFDLLIILVKLLNHLISASWSASSDYLCMR